LLRVISGLILSSTTRSTEIHSFRLTIVWCV